MGESRITAKNVSVDLPVYDGSTRSFKKMVIGQASRVGGVIRHKGGRSTSVRALSNIDLELGVGDKLAIVGHNGAGKSTLLRVLAGIFEPTEGTVQISGQVLPIFDISLGMDFESSGYENIYLRTLYLGEHLRYSEQMVKEIIEFAELGEFANLPVRTYSTGMVARLQFAITTAMRPDILIMDEGIGAGDAAFFEKAQRRLESMLEHSGIMVLATHSEAMSKDMCNRAILLEHGHIVRHGTPDEVWAEYFGRVHANAAE